MSCEPHDLHHEFPEYHDEIHHLKETDTHFRRLFDEYHRVVKELEQIEARGNNRTQEYIEACKKMRLALKDMLFAMLQK